MPSARKRSRRTREWKSDAEYIKDQDETTSWSSQDSPWGDAAAKKFVHFGHLLGEQLCHNDKVADFGGNDGWASWCFYNVHKIKPLVVDCEPKRIEHAMKKYLLPTYQAFLEDMSALADKSIDWAFCSHTLEHTRDTGKAMREIARIVKRGCFFVMPLEDMHHAKKNHSHAICFTKASGWERLLKKNGWKINQSTVPHPCETQIYAEPSC